MYDDSSPILKGIGLSLVTSLIILTVCKACGSSDKKLHEKYIKEVNSNSKKYEGEITQYNIKIDKYASYINNLNLSDLEVIMKVIHDQWNSYTYGESKVNIMGYPRLSFVFDQKGTCATFADDFTTKINEINPAYDAKNLFCYLDDDKFDQNLQRVNINRTCEETSDSSKEEKKKQYGNHVITALHIPDKNYILTVDSTNLTIGLLHDKTIYLFNNHSDDSITFDEKSNYIFSSGDNHVSYESSCYSLDTLVEALDYLYGYEAQNKAYQKVKKLDKKNE